MSEGFRVAYFPGCTLKTDARDFESSALAVARALGIEVAELSRWNCCGTVYSLNAVNLMPRLASVHNLIRAEEEGLSEIMTLCSMCYNTLKQTNNLFTSKNNGLAVINDFLCLKPGYSGRVKIYHFLEFLREKIKPEQVKNLVTSPLDGVAVAPYYGCLLLRPKDIAIDDPEKPEILTPFLSALGAKVIDFPLNNECCGAYQTTMHQETVVRRVYRIINSAQSEGAGMIAVSCPLCHYNLSALQGLVRSTHPGLKAIPILYFTEVMARAMGLDYRTGVKAILQDVGGGPPPPAHGTGGRKMNRLGVFICHCGKNIARTVDIEALREKVATLPDVVLAKDYLYLCSKPGQTMIADDIREQHLDQVLIAACSPRLHGKTFAQTAQRAGLNPYLSDMANIREHCSWVHIDGAEGTEKAFSIIKGSLGRLLYAEPLEPFQSPVTKRVLVIGGGIAGIQAALDIANSGYAVYLVEKSPSLGGHMAQLGETFPTLDCSSCILTPKMVEVSQNEHVHLLSYSEVTRIEGNIGQFQVTVRLRPRYVDETLCTGCGDCVPTCPVVVPNEFDQGLGARKAVYLPFPQAVPAVYTIDWDACLNTDKLIICENCYKNCEAKAINFLMRPEEKTFEVGAVILATGYELMPVARIGEYGGDGYEDVIDGLQFERMLSASGPTGGVVRRPSDGRIPQNVVFVQCSGSRDPEHGIPYCSKVCCMYTAKHALLYKHAVPDGQAYVFYIDIRAAGKGHEEFVQKVMSEERILYLRGKVSKIFKSGDKLVVWGADTLSGRQVEIEADLVVLAMAVIPSSGSQKLARTLHIASDLSGFFSEAHPKLRPLESNTDGIFLAGAAQFVKDITDTVSQATGAAGKALSLLANDFISLEPTVSGLEEGLCRGCGLCASICPFGAVKMSPSAKTGAMVAGINPVLCKGCGLCAAGCLSGAITLKGSSFRQIFAQLEELV